MNLKEQRDFVNDTLGIDAESEWALLELPNSLMQEIERENKPRHKARLDEDE